MLTGLVSHLLVNGVSAYSRSRADHVKKEWGFYAIAVICGVIAFAFLTSALYMSLASLYSPAIAAAMTGLAAGIASLACLYFATRVEKKEHAREFMDTERISEELSEQLDHLLADIEQPVRDNPGTALLLATLAGYLTADKLH